MTTTTISAFHIATDTTVDFLHRLGDLIADGTPVDRVTAGRIRDRLREIAREVLASCLTTGELRGVLRDKVDAEAADEDEDDTW